MTGGSLVLTASPPASDVAQNPYWKRDVRRAYPRLSVVTQAELSGLLIEHHEAQQAYVLSPSSPCRSSPLSSLAAPPAEGEHEHKEVPAPAAREPVDLPTAIATVSLAQQTFSASRLPPSYPTSYGRWRAVPAEDAPHDPHSYFPMSMTK